VKGDHEKAIDDFRKAATLNPRLGEAFLKMGESYQALGDEKTARESLEAFERLRSERKKAREILSAGYNATKRGRFAKAKKMFSQALVLDPSMSSAYSLRGLCSIRQAIFLEGLLDFGMALARDLRHLELFFDLFLVFRKVVDYRELLQKAEQPIQKLGGEGSGAFLQAFLRGFFRVLMAEADVASKGDLQEGIARFTRAVEENPAVPAAYLFRGYLYQRQGDYGMAETEYGKVLLIDPDSAPAYFYLATLYAARGERDAAFDHLEKALKLRFRAYERIKKDPYLSKYRGDPRSPPLLKGK
jgi:tetratricopeptide (TPR) repeat protein